MKTLVEFILDAIKEDPGDKKLQQEFDAYLLFGYKDTGNGVDIAYFTNVENTELIRAGLILILQERQRKN